MLAVARERAQESGVTVTFTPGDVHELVFADQSFDDVVCLRVLMHTPDWRRSLRELCRVSRSRVVFDYPALSSAAALQSVTRRLLAAAGRNVEAYRVFSDRAVHQALRANGFAVSAEDRQFVLPIAFHKLVGSPAVTTGVEGVLARAGMRWLFGSPVTVVAERCAS
jgi:ubiquinone/menaquinone biosynthesis C-methylase UbiE